MKIKFLTINIWNGGQLWNSLLTFLKKENPDILMLQEVYNGQNPKWKKSHRSLSELRKKLNFPFYSFAPEVLLSTRVGDVDVGNAVFSKFPILVGKSITKMSFRKFEFEGTTDFRLYPHNLQYVGLKLNDERLNLFNIHGVWDFHGEDTKKRLKMSEEIVKEIKGKGKVILAGDFNVNPNTKTIGRIEEHLLNVFKNELKTSFNLKRKTKGGYSTSVVDMIFVSHDIKVLDHYCPNVDVSDHMPLVAILEI